MTRKCRTDSINAINFYNFLNKVRYATPAYYLDNSYGFRDQNSLCSICVLSITDHNHKRTFHLINITFDFQHNDKRSNPILNGVGHLYYS